MKKQYNKQV